MANRLHSLAVALLHVVSIGICNLLLSFQNTHTNTYLWAWTVTLFSWLTAYWEVSQQKKKNPKCSWLRVIQKWIHEICFYYFLLSAGPPNLKGKPRLPFSKSCIYSGTLGSAPFAWCSGSLHPCVKTLSIPAHSGVLPSEMRVAIVVLSTVKGSLKMPYFHVLAVSTSLQWNSQKYTFSKSLLGVLQLQFFSVSTIHSQELMCYILLNGYWFTNVYMYGLHMKYTSAINMLLQKMQKETIYRSGHLNTLLLNSRFLQERTWRKWKMSMCTCPC